LRISISPRWLSISASPDWVAGLPEQVQGLLVVVGGRPRAYPIML
jgi:hypothetical protein